MRFIVYLLFGFFFHPNQGYSFFGSAFYNAIISPMCFALFSWIYHLESMEADDE
jgi:hypothetical protein